MDTSKTLRVYDTFNLFFYALAFSGEFLVMARRFGRYLLPSLYTEDRGMKLMEKRNVEGTTQCFGNIYILRLCYRKNFRGHLFNERFFSNKIAND